MAVTPGTPTLTEPAIRAERATMTAAAPPNPFTPDAKPDPYPLLARLRREAPVHPLPLPDGGSLWLVTRHADVDLALRDPRLSKRRPQTAELPDAMGQILGRQLLAQDPPDHTRLRRLVSQAFTPRLVAAMEPRIQHIADALLDRVAGKYRLDLIDDYAYPLPLTVIAELLGIPADDHEPFRRWSDAAVALDIPGVPVPQWREDAMVEFVGYLRELFARKRREPADDLVSGLLHAAEGGDVLSGDELLAMVWLLIVAGHETTVNLIGNGMLALLRHPAQLAMLRADPALLPAAVEELLRYDGPVETSTPRFSTAEVDLPGGTIPAGQPVLIVLASANRDEDRFADPDVLDLRRADTRHLAFGKGIHYCLGAPLARMEGRIAIGTALRRLPGLRPDIPLDELAWRPSLLMRGLRSFPVAFGPT
jgi:cytochrome P450